MNLESNELIDRHHTQHSCAISTLGGEKKHLSCTSFDEKDSTPMNMMYVLIGGRERKKLVWKSSKKRSQHSPPPHTTTGSPLSWREVHRITNTKYNVVYNNNRVAHLFLLVFNIHRHNHFPPTTSYLQQYKYTLCSRMLGWCCNDHH